MIIGDGLVASSFKKRCSYDDFIIFSSGVSNSKEVYLSEFNREKELLLNTIKTYGHLKIIYFSTVLVGFSDSDYCNHKLEMENLIKNEASSFIIFRVPQLVGPGGNKSNLINYISNCVQEGIRITVGKNVKRSLMCVDDMVNIVDYCKDSIDNCIITISEIEKMNVLDICYLVGSILGRTPEVVVSDEAAYDDWNIDNSPLAEEAISALGIASEGYTERVLLNYLRIKV